MAFCVACGSTLPDNARFCVTCGTEVLEEPAETAAEIAETDVREAAAVAAEPAEKILSEAVQEEPEKKAPKKRGRGKKAADAPPDETPAGDGVSPPDGSSADTPVPEISHIAPESSQTETDGVFLTLPAVPEAGKDGGDSSAEIPKEAEVYRPQFGQSPYAAPTNIRRDTPEADWAFPAERRAVPPAAPLAAGTPYLSDEPVLPPASNPGQSSGSFPAGISPAEGKSAPAASPTLQKPVSTAGFFWLSVLYVIPCLGLVMAVILALAPSNRNIRSFSKAVIILRIIFYLLILLCALAYFILKSQGYGFDLHMGIFYP